MQGLERGTIMRLARHDSLRSRATRPLHEIFCKSLPYRIHSHRLGTGSWCRSVALGWMSFEKILVRSWSLEGSSLATGPPFCLIFQLDGRAPPESA